MSTATRLRGDGPVVGVIDDEPTELEASCSALNNFDGEILSTASAEEIDNVVAHATGGLVLDARLDRLQRRSLDVAREYSRLHPGRPIFLVSNFFSDGVYDRIDTMVSPLATVHRIEKADLTKDAVREWINEELYSALADVPPERTGQARDPELSPDIIELLSTPPQHWTELSVDEQDDVADAIADALSPYVDRVFRTSEAAWLVLGGPRFQILRWGKEGSHPSDELLDEIQASEGVVPFFFARELEVDSIALGGIPWPGTSKNPHYPAVQVRFLHGSPGGQQLLLDTGADANYLDRTVAEAEGLRLGRRPRVGYRLSQTVRYRQAAAEITLFDGRGAADGTTSFRAVKDWEKTIGQGKDQPGLVSTLVLHDLQVAVRICGRTRTVQLDEFEDDD